MEIPSRIGFLDVNGRKVGLVAGLLLALLLLLGALASPGQAQSGEAYALIDAVNQLRAANGLPPYRVDGTLMSVAQRHSEYQASIGSITHTGPGGSRPKDRARAAGYGGGATIFVSENIAGGTSLDVQSVVSMWQGDAPHLNTMLSSSYTDIGAGVSSDGKITYYTIDVAYIAGQGGSGSGSDGSGSAANAPAAPVAQDTPVPVAVIMPVLVASPNPDGSVVHVVESGQALSLISQAYGVSLPDILSLNGLTQESIIRPGDEVLIKVADVTPTSLPTHTSTPAPATPTSMTLIAPPTAIATEAAFSTLPGTVQESSLTSGVSEQNQSWSIKSNTILVVIGVLVAVGTALLVIAWSLKRGA